MNFEHQSATVVLKGNISNLRCRRRKQDFVLSEAQHTYIEATAAGAAIVGMGASAIGLLQMSANSQEEADWVEFELDGKHIEGWLWKMPMSEGDVVEVVAEQQFDGNYFAYSIRRVNDGVIAIYPHATSGGSALYRRIMKYMVVMFVLAFAFFCVAYYSNVKGGESAGVLWFPLFGGLFTLPFVWLLFHRAYLKLAHLGRLAEAIFSCYGWHDVSRIDLARASKSATPANAKRGEYGVYYFCYNPDLIEK